MDGDRVQVAFLDNQRRRKRVCKSSKQAEPFLKGIIAMADKHADRGLYIHVTMDVESDVVTFDTPKRKRIVGVDGKFKSGDEFYHHRRLLQSRGITDEAIQQRENIQAQIQNRWKKKKPEDKVRDFNAVQSQRIREGMLKSNAHTIQIAVAEDGSDELAFVFQATTAIEEEFEGVPQLPSLFKDLLTHNGVVFVNVAQRDDIQNVVNSFYEGHLQGIQYAELEDVMSQRWEPGWEEDGKGLMAIFRRCFPNRTWNKDKRITMSHWWLPRLSDMQIKYALLDVLSPAWVLRATDELAGDLDEIITVFPDKNNKHSPTIVGLGREVMVSHKDPSWVFNAYQEIAAKWRCLGDFSPASVPQLLQDIFAMWKDDEIERKRQMATSTGNCDWDDISDSARPLKIQSDPRDFVEYANEVLGNLRKEGHLPPIINDQYVAMDVDEPPCTAQEEIVVTPAACQSEVNVAESRDAPSIRSIPSQASCDQSEASANGEPNENRKSSRQFEPLHPELELPSFELEKPSQLLTNKIQSALKITRPKAPLESIVCGPSAPESLAMALNGFDKPHSYVEKHARKLLAILADKWNDTEKYRCLKSLGSSAIILAPVAAIQLRLEIWDPILVLNSNIRVVIEILRSSNNSPKGFIKFWDALLEISEEERLEVARSQTFFHATQTSHYQRVLQNGVLRRLVLEACSQFQQKLPQFIQRSMLPKIVDTTVAALNKGRMLLSSAVDVLSRVEYSKNQKTIVNALSAPTPTTRALRTRLAVAWGQAMTTAETDHPIKSCCDSTGFFHRSAEHVNLRSKAEIDKFLQEVIAKAQSVTIHYRCHNDPRYNPNDVSMMSCKAPNVDRI